MTVLKDEVPEVTLDQSLAESPPLPHLRIEPSKGWVSLKLNELWEYRELLFFLTWRDIKVRYKQTVLGAAWAIIQPFITIVVIVARLPFRYVQLIVILLGVSIIILGGIRLYEGIAFGRWGGGVDVVRRKTWKTQ